MSTRVLLVDDHDLIRQGLARAFGRDEKMEVVGQAGNVGDALVAYEQHRPDVVVTDLQLPDGTGLDIIRSIRAQSAEVGLVMITMYSSDDHIFSAMQAGASAFVGKDSPSQEVVRAAAHAAVSPRSFLCSGLAAAMARRTQPQTPTLSDREQEVLALLADGLGAAAISGQLYLSESTVKTHITRIYEKLGASNRAQALVTAMRIGLLTSGPGPVSTTILGKK